MSINQSIVMSRSPALLFVLIVSVVVFLSVLPARSVHAHSALYDDYYTFDDSNGGTSVTPEQEAMIGRDNGGALGVTATRVNCENGIAAGYPCSKVDLQSFVSKSAMGGGDAQLNDIWGWTDPQTGAEIAIVGLTNGTSFIDVTDPINPVFLGKLNSHNNGSDSWRDIKVYNDHAFIVADGTGNRTHGLQVFDLRQLRNVNNPPVAFAETAHFGGFGNAHNIAINEDSAYAYVVGSNQCSGGLYMVNVADPGSPSFSGCFSQDGYVHDTQCVIYQGPDNRYSGREICVGYNEDTITIVDVTNKSNPTQISRTPYSGSRYTHQGWFLDENQSILIMNDELDESTDGVNTTSYIFDVSDLRRPTRIGSYVGPTRAIDHNLYTRDGLVFEANYRAGLRILDTQRIASGEMSEVAYFDIIPGSDAAAFSGAWSSYVYFESGNIVVTDIGGGLFVLQPDYAAIRGNDVTLSISDVTVSENAGQASVNIRLSGPSSETVTVTVSTQNRQAQSGQDYIEVSQIVRFNPGQTRRTLNVGIIDDSTRESTETFEVRLSNASNAQIDDATGVVTITDDDAATQPTLTWQPQTVSEGAGVVSIPISLSRAATSPVTVTAFTRLGSATQGVDYFGTTQVVRFEPGQTTRNFIVTVLEDDLQEPTESIPLRMLNASGATINTADNRIDITDNDDGAAEPTLSVSAVSVNEGARTARVPVRLSRAANSDVTVSAFTQNGTAVQGEDFYGKTESIRFNAGETVKTFDVQMIDDTTPEATENYRVRLINSNGASIRRNSATVSVIDNDSGAPTPTLNMSSKTVNEADGRTTITVVLTPVASQTVTVTLFTREGTATGPEDFYGFSRELTFAPGVSSRSATLTIINDDDAEPTEALTTRITNVNNARIGQGVGTITIIDDD